MNDEKVINNNHRIEVLKKIALYLRTSTLETILNANNGHIGGNLSSVELMTVLYFGGFFKFDPNDSKNEFRDRVLVRGHEGPLRYNIFSILGYIEKDELKTYRSLGSRLQGHEDMHITPGVDITPSGSLGMLLSYGVGSAISNKDKGIDSKTIVFLGDGEEQEGNISEAARHAASLNLDNLICILDKNEKQLSRPTKYSDGNSDVEKIWNGYGWDVIVVENGNDIEQIMNAYKNLQTIERPTIVIAKTIKGLGVQGCLEHFSGYHTLSSASNKQLVYDSYNKLKKELETQNITYDEIQKMALSLVTKPTSKYVYNNYFNSYDIRTTSSGINLEIAQDLYLKELKNRIMSFENKPQFYFVTPDLLRSDIVSEVGFDEFSHFIDTGIREQHAIGMCHGISVENPNARIYVCYGDAFAYRALDQINAAATGKSNIMIVGENAGIFQGQNGKTHQSIGQPEALMSIPELEFYEPADSVDLYNVFSYILKKNTGVSYVRFHRGTVYIERDEKDKENVSAYFIHKSSNKPRLLIITSGFMAETAVKVAKRFEIEYGISANVVNIVNHKAFKNVADKLILNDAPILTLYNGNPNILSRTVSDAIFSNENIPKPKFIKAHGFINGTSGKVNDLIDYYGFTEEKITQMTLERLKNDK